jgi:hypothetical protein
VRVLLIVVSEDHADEGCLLPLACLASAYYALQDASIEVVLASRTGGYLFLDQSSAAAPDDVGALQRFQADRSAREDLADTIRFDDVDAEDFDGAMCLGPPADDPAQPLPTQPLPEHVCLLVSSLLAFGKPVVVIPEYFAPAAGNGLLITGNRPDSPRHAAAALIGVLNAAIPRTDPSPC